MTVFKIISWHGAPIPFIIQSNLNLRQVSFQKKFQSFSIEMESHGRYKTFPIWMNRGETGKFILFQKGSCERGLSEICVLPISAHIIDTPAAVDFYWSSGINTPAIECSGGIFALATRDERRASIYIFKGLQIGCSIG